MSKEKKLRFYPGKHVYYVGRTKLTSVTTKVGQFFSKFDTKGMAKNIASGFKFRNRKKVNAGIEVCELDKQKATQRYWINEWRESADSGSRIHNATEFYIQDDDCGPALELCKDEKDENKFRQAVAFLDTLPQFERTYLNPEVQLFDEELGLAGTIDLLINNEDGTVSLADWKSNKAIKKSGYNKEMGKAPLEHVPDANYYKYCLQLSLYAYMLERKGMKIRELIIVHLKEDEYIPMVVPYMKKEVEDLLSFREDADRYDHDY